ITDGSRVVTVTGPSNANAGTAPTKIARSSTLGGPDGAAATATEIADGLAALAPHPVNILAIGGLDAKTAAGTVLAHLEATENDGKERIAVLGASSNEPSKVISDDVSKGSN